MPDISRVWLWVTYTLYTVNTRLENLAPKVVTRPTKITTRPLHGWKFLCQIYAAGNFWLHRVTEGGSVPICSSCETKYSFSLSFKAHLPPIPSLVLCFTYTPLPHSPKQIHPKQDPKQKSCQNRPPQANVVLKITTPSKMPTLKQNLTQTPSKNRKLYVPK